MSARAVQVHNPSAQMRMQGLALPAWMMLRELWWNGKDAIERTADTGIVDTYVDQAGKIVVVDTGCGMSRSKMVVVLSTILASGNTDHDVIKDGEAGSNHGAGFKLTALVQNPAGVIVRTLHDGIATELVFRLMVGNDQKGTYSIDDSNSDGPDGARTIDPASLDPRIIAAGHGTEVRCLGETATSRPGQLMGIDGGKVSFASQVTAMAARIWETPRVLQGGGFTVTHHDGTREVITGVLDRIAGTPGTDYGYVEIGDGTIAHWFTLPAGTAYGCKMGLISEGELYHTVEGSAAKLGLAECGIHTPHRIAVYFEVDRERITPNMERSALDVKGGYSLTKLISSWRQMFAGQLPDEIRQVMLEEQESATTVLTVEAARINRATRLFRVQRRPVVERGTRAPRTATTIAGEDEPVNGAGHAPADEVISVAFRTKTEMGDSYFEGVSAVVDPRTSTITVDTESVIWTTWFDGLVAHYKAEQLPDIQATIRRVLEKRITTEVISLYIGARKLRAIGGVTPAERFHDGVDLALASAITLGESLKDRCAAAGLRVTR